MSETEIRTILAATDFSACAGRALEWGLRIAREHAAALRVVHVRTSCFPVREAERSETAERLEQALKALDGHALDLSMEMVDGVASDAVVALAQERAVDLVVVGARGGRETERLLLGSTASGIVRKSACPVLTVPCNAALSWPRCVLLPVDFSGHSLRAAEAAAGLLDGERTLPRLVLLHALPPPDGFYRWGRPPDPPASIEDDREATERRLAGVARSLRRRGFEVATRVVDGEPAMAIERAVARDQTHDGPGPDWIAMGTRGRAGLDAFILGGVTRRVLAGASCPVLTAQIREDT